MKDKILNIVNEEIKENLGGDSTKIFIGGFSQGAALAFYVACEFEGDLGGWVMLSGHCLYSDPINQIQETK